MENKGSVLLQKYELGKLLGQGTFAKVQHARNIETGQSVAVKVTDKEKVLKVGLMEQIKREISVMRLVRHPNIVQLHEVLATKGKIYFIMEYVKGGELFNKIAKGRLKEDVARKYFQQLISAVDYCHSRGVYHRDLKPENLLLDENGDLKVSDFGLSALTDCRRQDGLLHTTCGTPAYVAPEVINRKGYDGAKADIWSCGVILFVLMAGHLPFHDQNLMEMYRKIAKAEFKCPNWFPSDVRRLLSKILDPNPNTRISISKIMDSPWFRKGFEGRQRRHTAEPKPVANQVDTDGILSSIDSNIADAGKPLKNENPKLKNSPDTPNGKDNKLSEGKKDMAKLANLNAFDIISLASGFDLSGLFEETANQNRKEARFTSRQSASTIISKLEDVAKKLRLKVKKKDGGVMKLEGSKQGRKGVLSVDAEIFEVTPSFHLVEMKKSSGDTLEYQKMWKNNMRPALKDIVWAWQGESVEQEPSVEIPTPVQNEVLLQA